MLNKFWEDVAEAYQRVASNQSMAVVVERDGKRAQVQAHPYTGATLILIVEKDTETHEPLPVP